MKLVGYVFQGLLPPSRQRTTQLTGFLLIPLSSLRLTSPFFLCWKTPCDASIPFAQLPSSTLFIFTDEKSNDTMADSGAFRSDETDSTTDADRDIFSDGNDDDTNDKASLFNEESPHLSDDDTDDEASLFNDEEEYSLKHYLAKSAGLDVLRLRQRRYAPKTQARLNWVKEHWDQYAYTKYI
jgi:hypothetical protein